MGTNDGEGKALQRKLRGFFIAKIKFQNSN